MIDQFMILIIRDKKLYTSDELAFMTLKWKFLSIWGAVWESSLMLAKF